MNNPCEWCQKTSEQIDSLEFELEAKSGHLEHAQRMNKQLTKKLAERRKELEAKDKLIGELEGLVSVANCPNCDGGGAYYDNYGEVCQCQWCNESYLLTKSPKSE